LHGFEEKFVQKFVQSVPPGAKFCQTTGSTGVALSANRRGSIHDGDNVTPIGSMPGRSSRSADGAQSRYLGQNLNALNFGHSGLLEKISTTRLRVRRSPGYGSTEVPATARQTAANIAMDATPSTGLFEPIAKNWKTAIRLWWKMRPFGI